MNIIGNYVTSDMSYVLCTVIPLCPVWICCHQWNKQKEFNFSQFSKVKEQLKMQMNSHCLFISGIIVLLHAPRCGSGRYESSERLLRESIAIGSFSIFITAVKDARGPVMSTMRHFIQSYWWLWWRWRWKWKGRCRPSWARGSLGGWRLSCGHPWVLGGRLVKNGSFFVRPTVFDYC